MVGACRRVRDPFPLGPVVEAVRQLAGAWRGAAMSPLAGVGPVQLVLVLPLTAKPLGATRMTVKVSTTPFWASVVFSNLRPLQPLQTRRGGKKTLPQPLHFSAS